MPGLLCPRPFEWLEIHPGGGAFLCCPAWLKRSVGNVLNSTLDEIWNGKVAIEIRKNVLNSTHYSCNRNRCPFLAGGRDRLPEAHLLAEEVSGALKQGHSRLDHGPKILNLSFDRACNLRCPSCRGETFRDEEESAEVARQVAERVLGFGGDVEMIRLSGYGDPFASPRYRNFLSSITPENFPVLESLSLHTNGQLWDEAAWRGLGELRGKVREAEISVDAATSGTYGMNRVGGCFSRLMKNLDFVSGLPVRTTLSFVVQGNNFREMPRFVSLAKRRGFRVYFSQLVNWGTFSRQEFLARAVHLPQHPEHEALIDILKSLKGAGKVDLGNLSALVR